MTDGGTPDTVADVTADPGDEVDVELDGAATPDDEHDAPVPVEPARRGGMTTRQWVVLALIVPLVLGGAFVAGRALRHEDPPGLQISAVAEEGAADWNYVIPEGTADRIKAGDDVQIVPAELVVTVGDTIRIVNHDAVGHVVGVFFVGAGETVTQQFQSVGELTGDCSVHPSGAFTLRVESA